MRNFCLAPPLPSAPIYFLRPFVGKQPSILTTIRQQRICRNRPCYVGVTATAYPQSVSMHRHGAIVPKTPLPVNDQTLICPLNVIVGRLVIKGSVGQVNSLIKKFLCDFFSHRRMMQRVHGWINPKFSRVNILSHAANVAPEHANKNVRGAAI